MVSVYEKYIRLAWDMGRIKSSDLHTKVGAVIVDEARNHILSTGYNHIPHPLSVKPERLERPAKYHWIEHAERHALLRVQPEPRSFHGCTLILCWSPPPCIECTRAAILAGISRIVGPNRPFPTFSPRWQEEFVISNQMLREANIEVLTVDLSTPLRA